MLVPITRLRDDIPLPAYHTPGSAAFDLASAEALDVPPRSLAFVPTGLIIQTPPLHVLMLTARSSLFKKKGLMLANGVGTIDSDYSGPDDEIKLIVWNATDQSVHVDAGERLAQGLIIPIVQATFVDGKPAEKNRGGIGSTGGYTV